MSRRRFFSSAAASSSQPGSRLRSWAECYAASCSSESDGSGRESPDQSHTVDPPSSSSSSSVQPSSHHSRCSSSSPGASPLHRGGRSRSCSPAVSLASERTVLLLSRAPSASWSRPSTSRIRPAQRAADQDRNGSPSFPDLSSRGGLSRQRRLQVLFRRTHHGRRLWGHLPVAIPPDRWYTGVGSLVCAQCRSQRSFQRTSWMCLECQVPLCLLTWRNCYSQWHSGE